MRPSPPDGDDPRSGRRHPADCPTPVELDRLIDHIQFPIFAVALDPPVPATLPPEEQIRLILSRSVICRSNDANARLYGFTAAAELVGVPVSELRRTVAPEPELEESLGRFILNGYRLHGGRGVSRDGEGGTLHFLDDWLGIVENGALVRIWGVRRDVTAHRRTEELLREATRSEYEEIVGRSSPMRRLLDQVERVAASDATVLLTGETGTGKELVARAIHRRSPRRAGPLVTVNCGAISTGLVESELFGHERGAFTGALNRKIGRFELADGGTLFLDEIGDLPADLQVKLLRVLQEREIERVGGHQPIRVDVRVIAATHRDLAAAVADGGFREDLYYRLNVFHIHSPALRERIEDLPLLVASLVQKHALRQNKRIEEIPRRVLEGLAGYHWPGNVRELANVIERAVILSPGSALELVDWTPAARAPAGFWGSAPPAEPKLRELERRAIVEALERCGWRVSGPRGAPASSASSRPRSRPG